MNLLIDLYSFLLIDNFSGTATLLAALVALIVYNLQKQDNKISAARVLLSEVRNAENRVNEIQTLIDTGNKDYPPILSTNSWSKYSNLFSTDFDTDEIEELNSFYYLCEAIENYAKKDSEFFWITAEHRAKVVQTKLVELVEKSVVNSRFDTEQLNKFKGLILDNFSNDSYDYSPKKTISGLKKYLTHFKKITTSSTGAKLKKIANLNTRKFLGFI